MTDRIEMCRHFNPLLKSRCDRGHRGTLKCHSKNGDCPDYGTDRTSRRRSEALGLASSFRDAFPSY